MMPTWDGTLAYFLIKINQLRRMWNLPLIMPAEKPTFSDRSWKSSEKVGLSAGIISPAGAGCR